MTRGARHAVVFLFALTVMLASANLLWASHNVGRITDELSAECAFNRDLAPLPVTVPPGAKRASVLGVEIVADARAAWHVAGCKGSLPPPSPSLLRWAAYYHRKVQR